MSATPAGTGSRRSLPLDVLRGVAVLGGMASHSAVDFDWRPPGALGWLWFSVMRVGWTG
ncbi:MAG: hypothetical protein HYU66_21690, partial [Armatimonadetes bacterium]|nr:hypothetical protein [Armatimonadota bacterium]